MSGAATGQRIAPGGARAAPARAVRPARRLTIALAPLALATALDSPPHGRGGLVAAQAAATVQGVGEHYPPEVIVAVEGVPIVDVSIERALAWHDEDVTSHGWHDEEVE